jgi:hypothetical protein
MLSVVRTRFWTCKLACSCPSIFAVDYQALCDAGWRRSGTFIYLPNNAKTCCPNITIRLDATKFRASKDQLKVLKNLHRFLSGELDESEDRAAAVTSTARTPGSVDSRAVADAICSAIDDLMVSVALKAYPGLPAAALSGTAVVPVPLRVAVELPLSVRDALPSRPTHASNVAFCVAAAIRRQLGERRLPKKKASVPSSAGGALPSVATPGPEGGPALVGIDAALLPRSGLPDAAADATGASANSASATTALKPFDIAAAIAAAAELEYKATVSLAVHGPEASSLEAASESVRFVAAPSGHINIFLSGRGFWALPGPGKDTESESASTEAPVLIPFANSDVPAAPGIADGVSSSTAHVDDTSSKDASAHKRARQLPVKSGPPVAASAPVRPPAHSWRVDMVPAAFDKDAFELYRRCVAFEVFSCVVLVVAQP